MNQDEPQQVKDLLPNAPFQLGGGLDLDTGRETFVALDQHKRFKEHVQKNRVRGVCVYPLSGPVGIGRTWTLAWLARQAVENDLDTDERWEAALVSDLGGGEVRDLYQSIFSATEYLRGEVEEDLPTGTDSISGRGREGILNHAVMNRESWAVLTGNKGRFPSISGIDEKPKWTQREVQTDFLRRWLTRLYDTGVDNLLILIDEFETTVTRLSSNKMTDFSDGLRRLYDVIEQEDNVPNVEIIISATTQAATKIDPTASSKDLPGWLTALESRMVRGFSLGKISEDDAKQIASRVIDYRRTVDLEDQFEPYTEASIETAFDGSDGLTRRLGEILNEMYIIAYTETQIDEEIAREAVEALDYDLRMLD
ncbi:MULTISPECIES: hypothetical protein [Halobacterium]|uniref:hypothetical protein n=1 Tax=Halobacterium TaxID=2239 RepID=UPI000A7BC57E|nr:MULTISPECIES: hypothetical protein [Halobacterium]MCG1004271.1 ATP-binding protein [Halobacterium noricense]